MVSAPPEVLETKLDALSDDVREIRNRLDTVGEALVTLTRLEERHEQTSAALSRTFATLESQHAKIDALEREIPALVETRKWVVSGVVAGVGMVLAALVKTVVVDPAALQAEIARAVQRGTLDAQRTDR